MACCVLIAGTIGLVLATKALLFGGPKDGKTSPLAWRLRPED